MVNGEYVHYSLHNICTVSAPFPVLKKNYHYLFGNCLEMRAKVGRKKLIKQMKRIKETQYFVENNARGERKQMNNGSICERNSNRRYLLDKLFRL